MEAGKLIRTSGDVEKDRYRKVGRQKNRKYGERNGTRSETERGKAFKTERERNKKKLKGAW